MAETAEKQNKKADKPTKPTAKTPAKPAAKTVAPLVRAHARKLRIAPRKMRLVTNLVKGMRVTDAVTQLQFVNKKGALMLQKLLQSAAANAENNFSLNRDNMFIKSITCDMGPVLQRSFPRARGSAFIIRRKMAHVNVVLEERDVKVKKKKPVVAKVAKPQPKTKLEKIEEADKAVSPEAIEAQAVTSTMPEDVKVQEIHNENTSETVKEETSPQNLNK